MPPIPACGQERSRPSVATRLLTRLTPSLLGALALLIAACSGGDSSTPDAGGNTQSDGGFTAEACETLPSLVAGSQVGPATDPGSACRLPIARSAYDAGTVNDLGHFKVGAKVNFTLPANTWAFSIVSQGVNVDLNPLLVGDIPTDNTVFPDLVTTPSGAVVYDSNDSTEFPDDPSGVAIYYPLSPSSPVTGVMTVPNSTAALQASAADGGFPSGKWSFQLTDIAQLCAETTGCTGGSDGGVYDVTVLARNSFPPAQGTLNLDIYLLTTDGLTHDSAATDGHMQRMLNTLSALYQASGICLGTVTFFDLPDWVRTRYGTSFDVDTDGPCTDLGQLYTLSQQGRNAVPLFLVESLTSTDADNEMEQVLGKDGTIPGPASLGGTIASGVVVTGADLSSGTCTGGRNFSTCGADRVAYIAAHEIGHYMGLYHTTEAGGTAFDPLSDTAHCQCQQCVSASRRSSCIDVAPDTSTPTQVLPADCAVTGATSVCSGATNLMFWALDASRAVGTVSGQQGSIARTSPVLR